MLHKLLACFIGVGVGGTDVFCFSTIWCNRLKLHLQSFNLIGSSVVLVTLIHAELQLKLLNAF